ncbi:MAG: SOS response-associated peptidase [Longimonas sp.]|uniref:SOS response-associated peptidase n=1 Tax=Longimonas sp. TaxID=2039626 RepID=UPI0039767304
MCGRFVEFSNLEQLKGHFPIDKILTEVTPNYNVAPTQEILAIVHQEGLNVLEKLHWGLVPHWAEDISTGYKMINARMETVSSKPGFRDAFRKRRCLIPADGFYEWKGPKGDKQPFFITLPDEKPFAFAGLWETWRDKDREDELYRSCSIITRDASECLKDIHDRMPAVLSPNKIVNY